MRHRSKFFKVKTDVEMLGSTVEFNLVDTGWPEIWLIFFFLITSNWGKNSNGTQKELWGLKKAHIVKSMKNVGWFLLLMDYIKKHDQLCTIYSSDHSESQINLNILLKLEDFLLKPDTLLCWNEYSSAELIDTVENLRELWGTWVGLQTTSREVRSLQLSITHPCILLHTAAQHPITIDTHRRGKVTMILILGLLCLSSTLRSQFHRNIFSGAFELLSNSHTQTQLTVVEWLQLGRLRSALLSAPRHSRCLVVPMV